MKIGISTACFVRRMETEDALVSLKELGADTAEVYFRTFYEYRPEFSKKSVEALNGQDVHSVGVLSMNFEPQLFADSRRISGDGFYWLDQVMRSSQILGAKCYTFCGDGCECGADNFDYIADRMRKIAEFCSTYGITLSLKNAGASLYNRPEVFRELKSRCPQLCGAFDIKKARESGYPYQMYLKDMAGAISHAYLSDIDENGKTCLPGKGKYDYVEIFKRLKDVGFDGAALIDVNGFGDLQDLKNSIEYLKEIAYKLN